MVSIETSTKSTNQQEVYYERKIYSVSKERAIQIAANHNCVNIEIAQNYTDSELKEVLRQLKLKANF